MPLLRDFGGSLAGRIALVLTLGVASASIASLFLAEQLRILELERLQLERVTASSADMAERFNRDAAATQKLIDRYELFGVSGPLPAPHLAPPDPRLPEMLAQRLPAAARPQVQRITGDCFEGLFSESNRVAGQSAMPAVDCWQVSFADRHGARHTIVVDMAALPIRANAAFDPMYLLLIVLASALLSLWAARLTTVPLRRLAAAAQRFSLSIDPEPIPEAGPREVRAALSTFNLMQQRVREGFRERMQILAAIAHDLQTPITRLRLRLEQVQEAPLREKLIADLGAMQGLVRDGLDLARSTEIGEAWSVVDIDSLVASLVEDHADMGEPVTLVGSCALSARIKPDALTRCLENLVSNAIKYGGAAEVECRCDGRAITITVADRGPGIPPDRIEAMFEPFVRGETSRSRATGGTGIGLTIARKQAESFGATLVLANRAGGGLVATLAFAAPGG